MVEKLKSILKPIHWSLVLKSAAFGASWFFLPLWAFLVLAFYFYFIPLFKPLELSPPFFLTIFFAAIEPANVWLAIFFAVIFYLILGVKDLIFINRKSSYEVLALLLLFLTFIKFFSHFDSWDGNSAFFGAFFVSLVFFLLAEGFLRYGSSPEFSSGEMDVENKLPLERLVKIKFAKIAAGIMAFCIYALILVLLFLPMNFLYQSALLLVVAAILFEFLIDYGQGTLVRKKLISGLSIFFVFLVIILESAQWTL
ncbi:MAG: hypothetical protein Q7R94_00695 [bacterium]|nr:hypothetical protein [bacterium]